MTLPTKPAGRKSLNDFLTAPQVEIAPDASASPAPEATAAKPWWRHLKFFPAFWTITGLLSLIVNVILIVVLLSVGSQLFTLKHLVQDQLLGGLYDNFKLMDQARIKAEIPVSASVPAKFMLPLDTDTKVVLTKDTPVRHAIVTLNTGGLSIYNAPADIILPAGLELPIHLKLEVPVDQKIPVNLKVNVDIPLVQTDLHTPFVGLQNVVSPYYTLLKDVPDSWQAVFCGVKPSDFCRSVFP
jgi:hypothetical protein